MRAPWDYIGEPGAPAHLNVPTPEGRELGAHVSRFVDVEEARLRGQNQATPSRCNDCAGLAGTYPNGCPATLMNLLKSVFEQAPFFCHKGLGPGEEPTVLCRAFLALVSDDFKERLGRMIAESEEVKPRRITPGLWGATRTIVSQSFAAHGGRR